MDERILSVTESLMRRVYHLSESYKSTAFSVKSATVEMTMDNGLIELKAKFPRTLIEENLDIGVEYIQVD